MSCTGEITSEEFKCGIEGLQIIPTDEFLSLLTKNHASDIRFADVIIALSHLERPQGGRRATQTMHSLR